jgi:hypothetical protein
MPPPPPCRPKRKGTIEKRESQENRIFSEKINL